MLEALPFSLRAKLSAPCAFRFYALSTWTDRERETETESERVSGLHIYFKPDRCGVSGLSFNNTSTRCGPMSPSTCNDTSSIFSDPVVWWGLDHGTGSWVAASFPLDLVYTTLDKEEGG